MDELQLRVNAGASSLIGYMCVSIPAGEWEELAVCGLRSFAENRENL